jgi:hypothetical protein
MMTNGHTMYCTTEACPFYMADPPAPESSLPAVLARDEVERVWREGVNAYHAGLQFHQSPYAHSGADVPDDEYQRGVEWRRGWNDAALGRAGTIPG